MNNENIDILASAQALKEVHTMQGDGSQGVN